MKRAEESLPIFNIERFAIHDGPGIRTTVFLQGCPLRCKWCANPESHEIRPRLLYLNKKCIGCGRCQAICPRHAITISQDGKALIDREKCKCCGTCAESCLGEALKISGKWMSPEEIYDIVIKDKDYYKATGGGVTFSGGEALLHIEKLTGVLRRCNNEKISLAVETCGYVSKEQIELAYQYFDLFLFDLKTLDTDKFYTSTGGKLETILFNLKWLSEEAADRITLRIPVIPQFNHTMEEVGEILSFACKLGIKKADLLPYHTLGLIKYRQLGVPYEFPCQSGLSEDELLPYKEMGEKMGIQMSIGG